VKFKTNSSPDRQADHIRLHRLSAVAALIVPLLLFAFVAWQDYNNIMHSTKQDVRRTTEIFRQHALNVFETHQLVTEAVNVRIKGMSWDEIGRSHSLHLYLKRLHGSYPQVQSIWLADTTGLIRNASIPLPAAPVRVADRVYFQTLRQSDIGTFIGPILSGRVTNTLNFNVARRREGESKAFDGVVVVTVFPKYFSDFWNKVLPKEDAAVSLLRSDGSVLARAPRLNPDLLHLQPTSPVMQAIHGASEGFFIGQSVHDKVERIHSFAKVGGFDAYIVNGINVSAAIKKWKEDLLLYGILFGCATTALLLLALTALHRANQEQMATRHWRETAEKLKGKSEELQAITQRLRLATDSGRMGVWEWDIKSGGLVWDERMFELYGISPTTQKVTFATWKDSLHPDDRDRAQTAVQSAIEGELQLDMEFRLLLADGEVRHIKVNALVVRDADGNAVRMIGINYDITGRKRLEMELAQHREHLEELVKQRTETLNLTVKDLNSEISERLKAEELLRESEETLRQVNADLDQRVRERALELEKKYAELERMNRMFVGRELRMIELKERIKELEGKTEDK
jgi:PAS domain S-box-containing protein